MAVDFMLYILKTHNLNKGFTISMLGLHSGGLVPVSKYKTSMEVTENGKHCSLQKYGIYYNH